jgi:hypothetical protein
MDARNAQLWQQIKDFAIDVEGAKLTFTDRLVARVGAPRRRGVQAIRLHGDGGRP